MGIYNCFLENKKKNAAGNEGDSNQNALASLASVSRHIKQPYYLTKGITCGDLFENRGVTAWKVSQHCGKIMEAPLRM